MPKPHAHIHSMQKTCAKFQNNRWKSVRGVVPTRYPLSIPFDNISYQKRLSSQGRKRERKIIKGLYPNHMHIFIPCKNISKVLKHSSIVESNSFEPGHEKMCLMSYANNKGADQPAHPRSLISAFVVRCLDSIISLDSITEISRL